MKSKNPSCLRTTEALPSAITRQLHSLCYMAVHGERGRRPGLLLGPLSSDREWAEKDFARRVDDYQYLFKVEEKRRGRNRGNTTAIIPPSGPLT